MNHDPWKPSWIRGGKIEEIIWIGKNVLAWCSGVHIVFFNIAQKKQSLRWCWNHDVGEGVRCLSAHSTLSIFAFSEKIIHPRILVFSYPSMTKVSECIGGCRSGYLATAFTARDHMVSMGSYPYFPMTVWCWRTGEKIATVNTSIRDELGQILRITQVGPTVVAQMGRTCGILFTWELDVAGKVAVLKDHEVKISNEDHILWVDWSPTSTEPLLALTDREGHIFLSNYDGTDVYRVVLSQRCGICMDIELPMVCWFRDGLVLRTTFCQIRYFKRNPRNNRWQKEWYVKSMTKPCILVTHPFKNDWLFYHTLEGYLMHVDYSEEYDTPSIKRYLDYGAVYRFADFVYPWCNHLVVADDSKELAVLECFGGVSIATIDPEVEGEIACQASHPDYPMIVLTTSRAEVVFISLVDPNEPRAAACLRLQRKPLDFVRFSYSGRSLVAAERKTGNCYCISLQRDKPFTVQALIKVEKPITDVLIYEGHKSLKVLVLYVGVKHFSVGQRLLVFEVPESRNLVSEFTHVLDLPGVYRTLSHVPGNSMLLVGSPYLTRQLRVQRLLDFKDTAMVDGLTTGHQVRLSNLFVDRQWITSTAFDGMTLVRDKRVRKVVACVMTHHRADFGSVKAMVSRQGDLIVCLGHNGSLVATRSVDWDKKESPSSPPESPTPNYRVNYSLYNKNKKKILSDYSSLDPAIQDLLTRPKLEIPGPEEGDKTWSEWRDELQTHGEEIKCQAEKEEILKDFDVLKGKVKSLLNANEVCPEIEKLPVSSFDLDVHGREQKLKAGRDECEDTHLELEHNASEMNRVAAWIKETFWDPQKVLGKSLQAILGAMEVTNYPSVAEDPDTKDHLQWAHFLKGAVRGIVQDDTFLPWRVYTEQELQVELNKHVKLFREQDRRIDLIFEEEEEDRSVAEEELERQRSVEGTTTHRFIEASPYYSQMESYGFSHVRLNNRFLMHDCEKLRAYFNQAFDRVYAMKEREMNVIRERIERTRYIDSELNGMFGERVPGVPDDPEWHWQERPEGIIEVFDHEVGAKPYVSPSLQEILDMQAAEAERIRQLLLADDFRERALMAMMDGVLEVRWEDVIKIDVPKPACMLEKKPEDYTAEDIQAVKRYEKDVQFLLEERQRYKRMLEAEYTRVVGLLQEGIDDFNGKVDELFRLKIAIEAAINQMHLRYIRGCFQNYNRVKSFQEEDAIKEEISRNQEYEATLHTHLRTFQHVRQELLSQHEVLSSRERTLARRFKSEFSTLSKLNMELLERQYKRRPRTNLKNPIASDLLELGGHVSSRTQPHYLPHECNDYLRSLDHLDARPATLPPSIDTPHWDHLVKLRRYRIDMEFKIRAKRAEIVDAETVIFGFEQRIEKCKNHVDDTRRRLVEMKRGRTIFELDVEMQLVMKMGQVEINLAGNVTDSDNAILVSRKEIEGVNELIRAAGACKMDALSRLMNFRRGTLLKEWEHECQKKRLEDLEEDLRFTESVTVTKEMQLYLKRRARGLKDDKTPVRMNEDIEAVKLRFRGVLGGHEDRLRSIRREIASTRSKNERLDRRIFETNVARCEMEQRRDVIGEEREREHMDRKIRMIMKRSDLIKRLQDNYAQLLELQTEHELLRLRRYPMFLFKTIDDRAERKESRTGPDFRPC